jgi:hypothetical protein
MGKYTTVYKEVEVEVSLEDFDTDALVEELEDRGQVVGTERYGDKTEQLLHIWQLRRQGQNFDRELDQYLYDVLGKVV